MRCLVHYYGDLGCHFVGKEGLFVKRQFTCCIVFRCYLTEEEGDTCLSDIKILSIRGSGRSSGHRI